MDNLLSRDEWKGQIYACPVPAFRRTNQVSPMEGGKRLGVRPPWMSLHVEASIRGVQ